MLIAGKPRFRFMPVVIFLLFCLGKIAKDINLTVEELLEAN
jgi:hypothetical protein